MKDSKLLTIKGLRVEFPTRDGALVAVNNVDLEIARGEVLGIVGESGSGKTVLGLSAMGLTDQPGRITAGQVLFDGEDVTSYSEAQWQGIRGNRMAMIFQDPTSSLNPVQRVGTQMIEALQSHRDISSDAARQIIREAMVRVGINSPDERLDAYPHQFSGGMRQRVVIAIALLNEPDLIIADEPTTALDVTIQAQILRDMRRLSRDTGTALIWVSHDLGVVAQIAHRVAVMYAGRIVEQGPTEKLLKKPSHPYTQGLIASMPANAPPGERLHSIPGGLPQLSNLPIGCSFAPRCPYVSAACDILPELIPTSSEHAVRCVSPLHGKA
ncbi:MAG TPA: methionine ABC transporter ATP-binding protein [Alphaproteobacteria bacterium]|nr:methionine ABC transporter ATP-binding protein [Alphaproteobacteria bacterium]|tara:strand:+ start:4805 stop:5782 length:978 start_codon:yes stop_codon:yes gene_type:complete